MHEFCELETIKPSWLMLRHKDYELVLMMKKVEFLFGYIEK